MTTTGTSAAARAAGAWGLAALLAAGGLACGDGGGGGAAADVPEVAKGGEAPLGAACRGDGDCRSGVCLVSSYGPPFCSRACDEPEVSCPPGDDAAAGEGLCVAFDPLPNPQAPPFEGELDRFCVPTCATAAACAGLNPSWETCEPVAWLGDPLYPSLGTSKRACQAPSFQGKDPVDPAACDWEKTIAPLFAAEANLCRSYCAYLDRCKELPADAREACCEWGCFNAMVVAGEVDDPWHDRVKCYVDNHKAFPAVGAANFCNQPPLACGGPPPDPTPPSAAAP